ncbi:MAG: hypothetical protein ACI9SQ_000412 [Rubritalea sp.]|jgi:hypothetical protein
MNSDCFGVVPPRAASWCLVVMGGGLILLTDVEKKLFPLLWGGSVWQ